MVISALGIERHIGPPTMASEQLPNTGHGNSMLGMPMSMWCSRHSLARETFVSPGNSSVLSTE